MRHRCRYRRCKHRQEKRDHVCGIDADIDGADIDRRSGSRRRDRCRQRQCRHRQEKRLTYAEDGSEDGGIIHGGAIPAAGPELMLTFGDTGPRAATHAAHVVLSTGQVRSGQVRSGQVRLG